MQHSPKLKINSSFLTTHQSIIYENTENFIFRTYLINKIKRYLEQALNNVLFYSDFFELFFEETKFIHTLVIELSHLGNRNV